MKENKGVFELLTEYLSRPDAEELFTTHAKAFAFSLALIIRSLTSLSFCSSKPSYDPYR